MEYFPTDANTRMALPLDKTCDFVVLKRGKGSDKEGGRAGQQKTNFHALTIRIKGGTLTSAQIRLCIEQAKKDCGPDGHAHRCTIGIERINGDWHIHIALVLKVPKRDRGTAKSIRYNYTYTRYSDLLKGTFKNEYKTEDMDKAVNVYQPGKAKEDFFTQYTFLAYPLKHLAEGENGKAIYPDIDAPAKSAVLNEGEAPTVLYYSIGLFDAYEGEELKTQKRLLSKAIKRAWETKLEDQKQIVMDGEPEFWHKVVPAFCKEHKLVMAKDYSNWGDIAATMWQYADLNVSYYLQRKWFGYTNLKDLALIQGREAQHRHVAEVIDDKIADFLERDAKRREKKRRKIGTAGEHQSNEAQTKELADAKAQLAKVQSILEKTTGELAAAKKQTEDGKYRMEDMSCVLEHMNYKLECKEHEIAALKKKHEETLRKLHYG